MDKLYIVVPAYNESKNIRDFVNNWYPIMENPELDNESRLIVINDGSKDNTFEILTELAQTHPKLLPLTKKNGGHGSAVLYGYKYAIEHKADFIFQTDSDGQTDPEEFEQFWSKRYGFDAIIGNRVVRGDGISRKIVENIVCIILRIIFGIQVKDANAPFRLMRTSLVARYINRLPQDFNIPNIMFTTYFVYYHEKTSFIPITFKARKAGKNSINIRRIVRIGWKAIGDFRNLKKEMVGDSHA